MAFLDADDLWHPNKLAQQMEAIRASSPPVGLVYCWSCKIDIGGVVTSGWFMPRYHGQVLPRLLQGNFVANGSAALVRADLVRAVGGFDTRLHAAGAQSCEDWLFYLRIASRTEFAVVEEHLLGYRISVEGMSDDPHRMLRSWLLVADEMRDLYPIHTPSIHLGIADYALGLSAAMCARGEWRAAGALLARLTQQRPRVLPSLLLRGGRAAARIAHLRSAECFRIAKHRATPGSAAALGMIGHRFRVA